MKKTMIMLMMVMMAVMNVNAQWVVADDYDNVYVSYDGGMTSQRVSRSQLPFGNMISKGNLQQQIAYYGQKAAEEEYNRTGSRMVYQQMLAQYGVYGGVYAGGVYGGVTPVTEDNMLATMGSGVYVGGTIGNVAVGGDPLMAVARVINFGKSLKKNKTNTTAPTRTTTRTATAPARTATRTATRSNANTNQDVNQNVTYNASKQRFETAEDLISGF